MNVKSKKKESCLIKSMETDVIVSHFSCCRRKKLVTYFLLQNVSPFRLLLVQFSYDQVLHWIFSTSYENTLYSILIQRHCLWHYIDSCFIYYMTTNDKTQNWSVTRFNPRRKIFRQTDIILYSEAGVGAWIEQVESFPPNF